VAAADVIAVHKPLGRWRGLGLVSFLAPVQQSRNVCHWPEEAVADLYWADAKAFTGQAVVLANSLVSVKRSLAKIIRWNVVAASRYYCKGFRYFGFGKHRRIPLLEVSATAIDSR
jgi:hypothetical protein